MRFFSRLLSECALYNLATAGVVTGSSILIPTEAAALEPLATFVEAARTRSFDNQEALVRIEQREAELRQSWCKLLPVLGATATYTRNQYESVVSLPTGAATPPRVATIVPVDQRDLVLSGTVALVDLGAWRRIAASRYAREAASSRANASARDVTQRVARDYYQLVAAEAVLEAATHALETARENASYVSRRYQAGLASELDFKRAVAERERNQQQAADAAYGVGSTRRELATSSGVAPGPGGAPLEDDLSPESPLADFERTSVEDLPEVRAQREEALSLEKQAAAARAAFLPTVSANVQERFTNAAGFGTAPYYAFAVSASWRVDASNWAASEASASDASAARIREARTQQQARDDIHNLWLAVSRDIEKAHAARAQIEATRLAAQVAHQRYDAGTVNFIDVMVAERDAFSAVVSRVQADADLAYARIALRLASGRSLKGPGGGLGGGLVPAAAGEATTAGGNR